MSTIIIINDLIFFQDPPQCFANVPLLPLTWECSSSCAGCPVRHILWIWNSLLFIHSSGKQNTSQIRVPLVIYISRNSHSFVNRRFTNVVKYLPDPTVIRKKSEIQNQVFNCNPNLKFCSVCGCKNLTNYRDLHSDPILSKSWVFFRIIAIICYVLCVWTDYRIENLNLS